MGDFGSNPEVVRQSSSKLQIRREKTGDVYVVAQPGLYGKSWQRVFTFPCLHESRLPGHRIRSLHVGDGYVLSSQPYLHNG